MREKFLGSLGFIQRREKYCNFCIETINLMHSPGKLLQFIKDLRKLNFFSCVTLLFMA